MHPTALQILTILAEFDEDALRVCYGIRRALPADPESAPLDAAIYAWIDAGRPIGDTRQREALAAAAMINRLASVSRHHHPHNLPNEVAATHQSDASAFLSRHGLDAGGRWIVADDS